jgi:hypothetical protein
MRWLPRRWWGGDWESGDILPRSYNWVGGASVIVRAVIEDYLLVGGWIHFSHGAPSFTLHLLVHTMRTTMDVQRHCKTAEPELYLGYYLPAPIRITLIYLSRLVNWLAEKMKDESVD